MQPHLLIAKIDRRELIYFIECYISMIYTFIK